MMDTKGVGFISMTEAALTMNVLSTVVHAIILYPMTPTIQAIILYFYDRTGSPETSTSCIDMGRLH